LYTSEEAELIVKMPYGLSSINQIMRCTHTDESRLKTVLEGLCEKGLVMDVWINEQYYYTVSPLIVGIFEFTMMRTRGQLNTREWARLFHNYLLESDAFFRTNFSKGQSISPLRILPHEESLDESAYVEILDYEKAEEIIRNAKKLAIGICSCRHEKLHLGEKHCDNPLDTCSSLGHAADHLIKHGMAREVSQSEMLDNLARSKDLGLVLCADNVRKDVSFICHCCGCCCNILLGISRMGFPNVVVSSNYVAQVNPNDCTECGACIEACPINAIDESEDGGCPVVNESLCLGCGVCGLQCPGDSLKLVNRTQRIYYPEDTFERVILQNLDQGTLQNLLFSDTSKITHAFLRGFIGGILKLSPIKRTLLSDTFRSRFISALRHTE